jgi:hypothetical protein
MPPSPQARLFSAAELEYLAAVREALLDDPRYILNHHHCPRDCSYICAHCRDCGKPANVAYDGDHGLIDGYLVLGCKGTQHIPLPATPGPALGPGPDPVRAATATGADRAPSGAIDGAGPTAPPTDTPGDANMYDVNELLDALTEFEALRSDDSAKRDLELTHRPCGQVVCDVEPGDELRALAETALAHFAVCR